MVDRTAQEPGMYYLQIRPLLFGHIPVMPWRDYFVDDHDYCIEALRKIQRDHYQKVNKAKVVEVDIPLNEIYC